MFRASVAAEIELSPEQRPHQIRIKSFGLPESEVNDRLSGVEEKHEVSLGYRAHFPEIENLAQGIGRIIFADGRVEQPVRRAMAGEGTVIGKV